MILHYNRLPYKRSLVYIKPAYYLGKESDDPNPPGGGPGDLPLGSSFGGGGPRRRLGPVPKMLVFGFLPAEGLLPRSCKVNFIVCDRKLFLFLF